MIQQIEDAASNYFETMTERVALTKEEHEKKGALINAMKENRVDRYETSDGLVVTVTNKAGVKCQKKKDAESNGEED